jgi:hypothetical protein
MLKLPTPNYRMKLVVMLTKAEEKCDSHLIWLIKSEWAATVSGQD